MSTSLRKIEYYGMYFSNKNGEETDAEKLSSLIEVLDSSFIYDDIKSNKFWCLDSKVKEGNLYFIVFKSGKYNHSPDYISRINGSERKSDKALDEGECEKTHLVIDIATSSLIIESRRNGISTLNVVKYINKFKSNRNLDYPNIVAIRELKDNFLDNLKALKRIQSIELYLDKEIIGSAYLNLLEPTNETQEEVIITMKAERKKTLPMQWLINLFKSIGLGNEKTKRVRVKGKDADNINILLDSLNQCKVEQIQVNLNENGTVNAESFFEKIRELI